VVRSTSECIIRRGVDGNSDEHERGTGSSGAKQNWRIVDIYADSGWENGVWVRHEGFDELKGERCIGQGSSDAS
jgi:hypothetical protein